MKKLQIFLKIVRQSNDTAGIMMPRRENKWSLYKITQADFYILMFFEGVLGNKSISRYAALSDLKKQGFFKNVPADVTINEILRSCEII